MSAIKNLMDEVAARMGVTDPNNPAVLEEVERLLSVNDRRLVVVESHPNAGGFWVGKVGTEREVSEYLKTAEGNGDLDYIYAILELKKGAHDEVTKWIEFDDLSEPIKLLVSERTPGGAKGTPPLPGLEARLAGIKSEAYGQQHSVWSILQTLADEEIASAFSDLLETMLQEGRTPVGSSDKSLPDSGCCFGQMQEPTEVQQCPSQ